LTLLLVGLSGVYTTNQIDLALIKRELVTREATVVQVKINTETLLLLKSDFQSNKLYWKETTEVMKATSKALTEVSSSLKLISYRMEQMENTSKK